LTNEVGQTTGLMGDRAARVGGCGFPVPGAKALGALREAVGPPTKAGAAPPRRGLPDEGGRRPWTSLGPTGATPGGAMDREIYRSASRIGSGGKRRPPVAPRCRGSRGAPDGRGRRGAPRRANALSSPGRQRKGRRKRKSEDKKWSP
jgi:hypothetical protein